jgi:protoporphyrinogen oxidase
VPQKKAIIIGGGPAGLTAAFELLKHTDIIPVVIEQSEYWGGISRTVNYKGNRIDIGGHRFFSKSSEVMDWWTNILPILSDEKDLVITYQNKSREIHNNKEVSDPDAVFLVRSRKSRIFFNNTFFDYPISLSPATIAKLGYFNTFLIGMSYMKSVIFPIRQEKSLEDFLINRFGKRLYLLFFKDYTEKVWGIKCTEISPEWGAQRIKGLSMTKAISHFLKQKFGKKEKGINQKKTETSLIEYFLYPKYGPGQLWDQVAELIKEKGGILVKHQTVDSIETDEFNITKLMATDLKTNDTFTYEGDYFFSTMPVKNLMQAIKKDHPSELVEVSEGLLYRDFITVGILLSKMKIDDITDNWIYVQEPSVLVGRLQIFNNWSPYLVEDENTIWLGMEYFCNETDELWNLSEHDMKALGIKELAQIGLINEEDVLDSVVIKMPKTYPAYFGTYNRISELSDYLNKFENLFLIGRNGMHKYNNQDHSMLTAIQAVQNIKKGIKTKESIWSINTEQEYHEEK